MNTTGVPAMRSALSKGCFLRFHSSWPIGPRQRKGLTPDRALQLRFVHLRAAGHVLVLGLLVELVASSPARARRRSQPTTTPGRYVLDRRPAGLFRLAGPGPLLVDGAGGDLLG